MHVSSTADNCAIYDRSSGALNITNLDDHYKSLPSSRYYFKNNMSLLRMLDCQALSAFLRIDATLGGSTTNSVMNTYVYCPMLL
jgi:hypothetical protein